MAVRIRKDGRILCAAMHPEEEGDCYIDDGVHYVLSVLAKVMVTDEQHKKHGQWWWVNDVLESDAQIRRLNDHEEEKATTNLPRLRREDSI